MKYPPFEAYKALLTKATAYTGQIPANLDQTVVGELEKLAAYSIIAFRDQKGRPEAAFDQPAS